MNYARWMSDEEMKKVLTKCNLKDGITKSGIPVMYDDKNLYISKNESQTLVIGKRGAGKTQYITLPMINLAMKSNESVVVNDTKGELYEVTANEFKNEGYNVTLINFDNPQKGNYWNPLDLVKKVMAYNSDKAEDLLKEIGNYIFYSKDLSDPFWTNSATDLFIGLAYYLLKNNDNVTFKDIMNLAIDINDKEKATKFLSKVEKTSAIYYHLIGVLSSPNETRASIVAVFNQSLNTILAKENLSNMLSKSDFDITSINKEKSAIFIVDSSNETVSRLASLLISQVYNAISLNKSNIYTNIILDDADNTYPINDISTMLYTARRYKIRFTVLIESLMKIQNNYKAENLGIIQTCFDNIIYLYSSDLFTLDRVSKLCGNKSKDERLASPEWLKVINENEAIVILPRMMPYKAKLIPNYKINWGYDVVIVEMPLK